MDTNTNINTNTLAILQPAIVPDLYYLAALLQSEKWIIDDTSVFSRKGRVHRFEMRTQQGKQWLGLPILTEDKKKPIGQIRIDHSQPWLEKMLKTMATIYRNSFYFDFYEPEVRHELSKCMEFEYAIDFILFVNQHLFRWLEVNEIIPNPIRLSQNREDVRPDSELVLSLIKGNKLFLEYDGKQFQYQPQNYTHPLFGVTIPEYRQHIDGFYSCSLLDLLFQRGPESFQITDHLLTLSV